MHKKYINIVESTNTDTWVSQRKSHIFIGEKI
jgi:hypothetical protein